MHDLAVTISIRYTSRTDTIFVTGADCFNTKGDFVKNYVNKTSYLKPLETAAIVINEKNKEGGTRANFVFVWKTKKNTSEPLFEDIIIATSGSQGLSFSAQSKKQNSKHFYLLIFAPKKSSSYEKLFTIFVFTSFYELVQQ